MEYTKAYEEVQQSALPVSSRRIGKKPFSFLKKLSIFLKKLKARLTTHLRFHIQSDNS